MSGCVDYVNIVFLPGAVSGCGLDRDPPFLFEFHGIHGGSDAVLASYLVYGVDSFCVVENPLGECGLARVNVGADTDIADHVQIPVHWCFHIFFK